MRHYLSIMVLIMVSATVARSAELHVGAAAVVITPPVGMPMAGYYHARAADGVHDELHATALVLKSDDTQAALVSLDLIATTLPLVEAAREAVERATGIPGGHVMISATHAHTGPVIDSRGLRASLLGGGTDQVRRYVEVELPQKIAEAVKQAQSGLTAVETRVGSGHEDSIAFNRRYYMKDGTVGWNPGVLNPDIVRPVGPIDPQVAILYFETSDKRPLGCMSTIRFTWTTSADS